MRRFHAAGLSPEFVGFASGSMQKGGAPYNILRPEAVESMFMLWRVTGDPVYREYGWSVFNAFQNYSRVTCWTFDCHGSPAQGAEGSAACLP